MRMDLKDLAAADLAWAMTREETYKADGIPVPEPIQRLGALAKAVQDASDVPARSGAPSQALVRVVLQAGARLGVPIPELAADGSVSLGDAVIVVAEIEKRAANAAAIREIVGACDGALKNAGLILADARGDLGKFMMAGEGPILPDEARLVTRPEAGGQPIALRHGLLLKQRKTGHRALFSEPKPGTFCYVWVSQDGKISAEPTGTEAANWRSDTWEECADVIEVKPVGLAGGLPIADAGPSAAPNQKPPAGPQTPANVESGVMIRDWNPNADEMAKSAADLKTAMDKAGVKVEIDVQRLVEKFKAEKGDTSAKRPGMAFYHWACKTLRGG